MRIRYRVLAATLIVCSAAATKLFAQESGSIAVDRKRSELSMSDLTALTQTSREIKKIRPDIPESVLLADIQIIKDSLPQIETEFGVVGLSNEYALWASQRAWRAARLESPLRYAPEKVIDNASFLEHVSTEIAPRIVRWEIRQKNPAIPDYVLDRDMRLVDSALVDVTKSFREDGWTAWDARNASMYAWKTARLESELLPHQNINTVSLVNFAENLAIVVFTSEPDQAQVFMGTENVGTTNKEKRKPYRFFSENRKLKVVFKKPDYVEQEAGCEAKLGQTTYCTVELKRN